MVAGDDDQIIRANRRPPHVLLVAFPCFRTGRAREAEEILDVHQVKAPYGVDELHAVSVAHRSCDVKSQSLSHLRTPSVTKHGLVNAAKARSGRAARYRLGRATGRLQPCSTSAAVTLDAELCRRSRVTQPADSEVRVLGRRASALLESRPPRPQRTPEPPPRFRPSWIPRRS